MTVRPQDLGGRKGFGPVAIEPDEPVYHAPWEGPVIAGILATMIAGLYNLDQFRAGIDDLDPLSYFSVGYYGRWLHTLEVNCVKAGVVTGLEIESRIAEIAERPGAPLPESDNPLVAAQLRALIEDGASNARTVPNRAGVRGRRPRAGAHPSRRAPCPHPGLRPGLRRRCPRRP